MTTIVYLGKSFSIVEDKMRTIEKKIKFEILKFVRLGDNKIDYFIEVDKGGEKSEIVFHYRPALFSPHYYFKSLNYLYFDVENTKEAELASALITQLIYSFGGLVKKATTEEIDAEYLESTRKYFGLKKPPTYTATNIFTPCGKGEITKNSFLPSGERKLYAKLKMTNLYLIASLCRFGSEIDGATNTHTFLVSADEGLDGWLSRRTGRKGGPNRRSVFNLFSRGSGISFRRNARRLSPRFFDSYSLNIDDKSVVRETITYLMTRHREPFHKAASIEGNLLSSVVLSPIIRTPLGPAKILSISSKNVNDLSTIIKRGKLLKLLKSPLFIFPAKTELDMAELIRNVEPGMGYSEYLYQNIGIYTPSNFWPEGV